MTTLRAQRGQVPVAIIRVVERAGIIKQNDLYSQLKNEHGSVSPAVSRLVQQNQVLKRSFYLGDCYIRMASYPLPPGHEDTGHEPFRRPHVPKDKHFQFPPPWEEPTAQKQEVQLPSSAEAVLNSLSVMEAHQLYVRLKSIFEGANK